MDAIFEVNKRNRRILYKIMDGLSHGALNLIPEGYNNNIIWNIGHSMVVQHLLVYKASGLAVDLPKGFMDRYMPNTKPTADIGAGEINMIKSKLIPLVEKTESDYHAGVFKVFEERTTQIGMKLNSFKEAMIFNNYHEGLHLGVILSLRKFV